MRHASSYKILLLSLASWSLIACDAGQSEKDIIAEAQFCLNKASPAQVDGCMAPLKNMNSFYANELKCAAGFVKADITSPENLSKAFDAISEGEGSPTVMLSALSFPPAYDTKSSDPYAITPTFENCKNSGSPGLQIIGAMAKSATSLSTLSLGSCAGDPDNCADDPLLESINDIVDKYNIDPNSLTSDDKETVKTVVETISDIYTSTCSEGFVVSEDLCKYINDAETDAGIDFLTTDPDQIIELGLALLEQWKPKP